ncbi:MAG TPA: helix-turn-helix domain-containing protein [Pseudonocardiaceae bacterium]|nr:helix-turn-helix domain-containing protein [Pseudonocardiaceae bacterium]
MSRWEPNARARLERAALDLFVERGYDATTVAEIAERAGLTKRTFFRHFTDKREVLFGGQEIMIRLLVEGIAGARGSTTPLDAIGAALEAVASVFDLDRLDVVRQRQTVIDANVELRERELLKGATLSAAMAEGFRQRGLPESLVNVAAQLGQLALHSTFVRWARPDNERKFTDLAQETLAELKTATAALDSTE